MWCGRLVPRQLRCWRNWLAHVISSLKARGRSAIIHRLMSASAETRPSRSFLKHNLLFLLSGRWALRRGHIPRAPHKVPQSLFGVCVATSTDPDCDAYILSRLRELNVRHVRVDVPDSREGTDAERLIAILAREGLRVCLHPVPSTDDPGFVREMLDRLRDSIDFVELGTTCNRRKWSGRNMPSLVNWFERVVKEIAPVGIPIAGPNVSDFEPVYNVGILGILRDRGVMPTIHTDNLFAERTTEPEAFDHKIAGRALAPLLKFNLLKKARLLRVITDRFGMEQFICSHVAWSLRRIDRVLARLEEKQADYVARYCCLAAASGCFDRVYWGPLIGQREGLIDDGTTEYPDVPHVTLYARARGRVRDYRIRPAYSAFATVALFLNDSQYLRPLVTARGLEIHEFETEEKLIHVAWTTNGNCAATADCYSAPDLATASCFARDGRALPVCPPTLGESAVYLLWPSGSEISVNTAARLLPRVRVSQEGRVFFHRYTGNGWIGMLAGTDISTPPTLTPEQLEAAPQKEIMRDRRNRVWAIPQPSSGGVRVVVKRLQVRRPYKRLLQRRRPNRALRSWNGANELRRRGIPTPRPLAYFQREGDSLADSYFVYRMFESGYSVRNAFVAFRTGKPDFEGVAPDEFYLQLADFLLRMHGRGVYYRDLSAGNILVGIRQNGAVEFQLIDTARARFHTHALSVHMRLRDLRRVVHPLHWTGRNCLLSAYMERISRQFVWWMRIPLISYDVKHRIKRVLRRKRRSGQCTGRDAGKENQTAGTTGDGAPHATKD